MKRLLLVISAVVALGSVSVAQTAAPFSDGDRAVFVGNSITNGGNTAADIYERLDGDVFSRKPTVLMLTFGMNDTGYVEYNMDGAGEFGEKRFQECKANFEKIEKRLQNLENVHVVLIGGAPYDETAQIEGNVPFKGKNAVMDRRSISFDYLAESLPYPLDTVPRGPGAARCQANAMKMVPFMEEMTLGKHIRKNCFLIIELK